MTTAMTDKQRRALEAMEAARSQGLAVREFYDAMAALRRKGVLPKAQRPAKSKFVSVRVAPASTAMIAAASSTGAASRVLCRIVRAGGDVIECLQWPEPSWLTALGSGSTDAAA